MNGRRMPEPEALLTPAEVATMFRVDAKTVTRWAKAGKITAIRTLGGHRRYRETEVRALLAAVPEPQRDTSRCPDCTYMLTSPAHRNNCASTS
jgi:excisionase family DNA binding protein